MGQTVTLDEDWSALIDVWDLVLALICTRWQGKLSVVSMARPSESKVAGGRALDRGEIESAISYA